MFPWLPLGPHLSPPIGPTNTLPNSLYIKPGCWDSHNVCFHLIQKHWLNTYDVYLHIHTYYPIANDGVLSIFLYAWKKERWMTVYLIFMVSNPIAPIDQTKEDIHHPSSYVTSMSKANKSRNENKAIFCYWFFQTISPRLFIYKPEHLLMHYLFSSFRYWIPQERRLVPFFCIYTRISKPLILPCSSYKIYYNVRYLFCWESHRDEITLWLLGRHNISSSLSIQRRMEPESTIHTLDMGRTLIVLD